MRKSGILNPQLNSLLSRVRHTNTVVIADRAFPFWPLLETVDLALVDDIPRVTDVLAAILPVWTCGQIWMADEFFTSNDVRSTQALAALAGSIPIHREPHTECKRRIPFAIGLIRTGDATPYANMILQSA